MKTHLGNMPGQCTRCKKRSYLFCNAHDMLIFDAAPHCRKMRDGKVKFI